MTTSSDSPNAADGSSSARREHLAPLLLLALAWLIYAGPLLSTASNLYETDTFSQDVPLRIHSAKSVREGVFPAWTTNLHCGYPLYADGQTGLLYPPFLLYVLSPTPETHDRFMALHYALAGLFAYIFLVARIREPMAACVGAITFMASTSLQSTHVVPGILASMCWLPLSLWLIDRYAKGGIRSIYVLALVNAMAILAGVVQAALYSFALQGLYFLLRVRVRNVWSFGLGLFLAFLLPPLLAAAQIVPTYFFSANSTRMEQGGSALDWEAFTTGRLDPRHLLTFFSPDYFGDPEHYSLPGQPYDAWAESLQVFCGYAAIVLFPLGLFAGRPRRDKFFWIGIVVLTLLCATASPVYGLVYHIPVFNWFRWPGRYMPLFALAVSVLTAMGANWLMERVRQRGNAFAFRIGAALVFLTILGTHRTMGYYTTPSDFYLQASPTILRERRTSEHFRLMPLARALYETWTMSDEQLRRNASFLPVSYNLLWNVPAAALFDQGNAVTPESMHDIASMQHPNALKVSAITHVSAPAPPEQLSEVERAIHGGYIPDGRQLETLADEDAFVARVRNVQPRAWVVHETVLIPDRKERLQWIASEQFDPSRAAVVEEAMTLSPVVSRDVVQVSETRADQLVVDVDTAARGLLVVADSFHDGWTATLDGEPVAILRVNHAFRGVLVPPGRHRVAFEYQVPGIGWGIAISAASGVFLIVAIFVSSRRGRMSIPQSA